jgi:hypothetical protein
MLDAPRSEVAALNQLEPRWRKRGYTLVREPAPEQLPSFLKGFRPDAIAVGADPQLVIEVLSKRGEAAARKLQQLRSLFEGRDDWRLEVVYVGESEPKLEPVPASDIRATLERLLPLSAQAAGAAFLMGWSTLEAAGRFLEPELATKGLSPASLIDLLVSNGHLSQSEGTELRQLAGRRNALAHGQIDVTPTAEEVRRLIELIEKLLQTSSF